MRFVLSPLRLVVAAFGFIAGSAVATGILVVAGLLIAAGAWIYNNWEGILEMFGGIADTLAERFPMAAEAVSGVTDALQDVWDWVTDLVGPIDATEEEWRGWGVAIGNAIADAIEAVGRLISYILEIPGNVASAATEFATEMAALAQRGWDAFKNINWAELGRSVVRGIVDGILSMGRAIGDALTGGTGGALSISNPDGAAKAGAAVGGAIGLAGKRASGGPVRMGLPYLVGERGPEIFVPSESGNIETNALYRRFTQAGVASEARAARGGDHNEFHLSIDGSQDPKATAAEVERTIYSILGRLESDQRNLLSD
ncbi:hypothetical protein [Amorphus sp. MBR-141]